MSIRFFSDDINLEQLQGNYHSNEFNESQQFFRSHGQEKMHISTWQLQDTPTPCRFNHNLARENQKYKKQPVQSGSKESQAYAWQFI